MMKIWIAAHKIRKYTLFGSVLKYFIKSYKIYISILNMTQRNDIWIVYYIKKYRSDIWILYYISIILILYQIQIEILGVIKYKYDIRECMDLVLLFWEYI